jgi:histidyl-tRNA synthetase
VPGSIGGGGRYDHLIAQLGGPDVPATGSSLGMERILTLLPDQAGGRTGTLDVVVTVLSGDLAAPSFAFAAQARAAGLRASVYLGSSGKLSRQLRWAADLGARWCLIYGNAEREAGIVTVRDLVSAEQEPVLAAELTSFLASRAADARG